MSIWKSPVFYFGVALAFLLVAALGAPFIVDWNQYKPELQAYGERLTGRSVRIDGPVAVRLFPWPRLVAQDVQLGEMPGATPEVFADVESVSVRVSLNGLFSGKLFVDEIELVRPYADLKRAADGNVNWVIGPDDEVRRSGFLDQVKLDKISIVDGTIRYTDEAKSFSSQIEKVSATLSAPTIVGPWRVRGALHYEGMPAAFTFTSAEIEADKDFKFGFKIDPEDGALPTFSFDGARTESELAGRIVLVPPAIDGEKANVEGRLRPLSVVADVTGNFDAISLVNIRVTPADPKDSSTLIEGSADIALKEGVSINAKLKAPRLNADTLLGAQSLEAWRAGGAAGMMNAMMQKFPQKLKVALAFDASLLTYAKQTLENVKMRVDAEKDAVRVLELSSDLPGQSRMLFNGVVFPGPVDAEFAGKVAVETLDLRGLLQWMYPTATEKLAQYWTGHRGRLKGEAGVSLSGRRFGLQDIAYELDTYQGTGELSYRLGETPSIDLRLSASTIDLDGFLSEGIGIFADPKRANWADIVGVLVGSGGALEKRITIEANHVVLNGVRIQDAALDVTSGLAGLDVKVFDIGSVAGARVSAVGEILNSDNGPIGDITAKVSANDAAGFLQLLGLHRDSYLVKRVQRVGKSEAQFKFLVQPGTAEPTVKILADGVSGPLTYAGTFEIVNPTKGRAADLVFNVGIDTQDGKNLLDAVGIPVVMSDLGAGRASFDGSGTLESGLVTKVALAGLSSVMEFNGTTRFPTGTAVAAEGTLSLIAPDGVRLARGLGMPLMNSPAGGTKLSGKFVMGPQGIEYREIKGEFIDQPVTGGLRVDAAGQVSADFEVQEMQLSSVLAPVLMRWRDGPATLDDAFSDRLPFITQAEIWLRPKVLQLWQSESIVESAIGIQIAERERRISVLGRNDENANVALELSVVPAGGQFGFEFSGHVPVDLDTLFQSEGRDIQVSGKVILDGRAKATGLTPYAVLADLTGEGKYSSSSVALTHITPDMFAESLPKVSTSDELSRAIGMLETGKGYALGAVSDAFKIEAGLISFAPIQRSLSNAALTFNFASDLPAGVISMSSRIEFAASAGLPPATVIVSGEAGRTKLRSLTSEIASTLGYEILARDLAELERVQKEQQALLAKEEQQRQADVERFEAYQQQRTELRLRTRELKVHAQQRERDAVKRKTRLNAILDGEPRATQSELSRRRRDIRIYRQLRQIALAPEIEKPLVGDGKIILPDGFEFPDLAPSAR